MNRHAISRRRFLKGATLGTAAVCVQPFLARRPLYAAAPGNPGKFMVVINMLGGNDGLNTVIPTHLSAYTERRTNINLDPTYVNPSTGVSNLPAGESLHALSGGWNLHYGLGNVKTLWDAGDLHIVQKVSYPNPNQSHFTSQDIYSAGVRDLESDGDGRGWLGRFADVYCASPVEPLGVVSVGVGRRRDFEADTTPPLVLGGQLVNNAGNSTFVVDTDDEPGQDGALRLKVVRETLGVDSVPSVEPALKIFNTNKLAYDLVDRVNAGIEGWVEPATPYPGSTLGRHMESISRLIHGIDDFGTRVFYTGFGGFDTHSAQHAAGGNSRHEQLMEQLDAALGAFAADMQAKGQWSNCCVVVISEFGRRNFENGSVGTDHGWGNCFMVAGGDVKSGMTGDVTNSDLADNNQLPFRYDFRDLYGDILQSHLGLDPTPLFPDPDFVPAPNDIDVI